MINIFKSVVGVLNDNKVFYWLEFGTLLGLVREKKFIAYDGDIDIGVYDINDVLKCSNDLLSKGFNISLIYKDNNDMSTILRIENDVFHVDVYLFEREDGYTVLKCNRFDGFISSVLRHLYLRFKDNGVTLDFVLDKAVAYSSKRVFVYPNVKTKWVSFYGVRVQIPVDAEDHLRLMYGDSWRIPTREDVAGREYISDVQGKTTFYCLDGGCSP